MKQLTKGMVLALALCLGLMFNAPALFAAGGASGVNSGKTSAEQPAKKKSKKKKNSKAKPQKSPQKTSGKKIEGKKQAPGKPGAKAKKVKDFTPPKKPININRASAAELEKLYGIGPVISKRIVDYRKKHGSFKSLKDLKKVKGIGPKLLGKNGKYMKLK